MTVSTATLALIAAAAGAGRSWLLGRMRSSEAPAAPATVRVVTLEPETVVSALHYSAAVKEFEKAELSFRELSIRHIFFRTFALVNLG